MRRLALAVLAAATLVGLTFAATGALAQNDTNETTDIPDEPEPGTGAFRVSCQELRCTFNASEASLENTTIESYSWSFGDDGSATGSVVQHTFTDVGNYTVTLTLEGADGTTANHTRTLEVTADRHGDEGVVPWSALGLGAVALVGSVVIARMT